MTSCIFCKIVAGEIPAQKTYEDENVVAFLDIHPKGPEHTLVIPKAHYQWFHELPDDLYSALFASVKTIAKTIQQKTKADYIKLGIVGTDVPHAHVHLIPRFLKDKEQETI